jgi:hypothetical protein
MVAFSQNVRLARSGNHGYIPFRDHVRKFFGNEGPDREVAMRHKFRMGSQFKHDLGSNVVKPLGACRGVTKLDGIGVLIADLEAPRIGLARNFLASYSERAQEISTYVTAALRHHVIENA